MNRKPIIIIAILALIGTAFGYTMLTRPKMAQIVTPIAQPENPKSSTSATSSSPSEDNKSQPGKYVSFSSQSLASTPGTKILFFHAPWCPQCRALEADIKTKTLPHNVTIFKVDYDTNQALRQEYGVTIQTTLVKVNDDGDFVSKYVAYNEPTLASVTSQLLP